MNINDINKAKNINSGTIGDKLKLNTNTFLKFLYPAIEKNNEIKKMMILCVVSIFSMVLYFYSTFTFLRESHGTHAILELLDRLFELMLLTAAKHNPVFSSLK